MNQLHPYTTLYHKSTSTFSLERDPTCVDVVLGSQAAPETRLSKETQPPAEDHVTLGDGGSPQSSQVISRRTRGRTSEVTPPFQTA